jgi:hypothetical protein
LDGRDSAAGVEDKDVAGWTVVVAPEVAAPVELIAADAVGLDSVEARSAAGDRVVVATGNGRVAVRIAAAWDLAEQALAAVALAVVGSGQSWLWPARTRPLRRVGPSPR